METNGKMCCLLKTQNSPVTREDLKIKSQPNELPINIIMDGVLMRENLAVLQIKMQKVDEILKKAHINKLKRVLILTIDALGNVFVQEKSKPAQSFRMALGVS